MEAYEVDYSDNTKSPIVLDEAGKVVPLDADDPWFCHFLSWVSRQTPRPLPFTSTTVPDYGVYFATAEDLIEHCKREGVVLNVIYEPFPRRFQLRSIAASFEIAGQQFNFFRLERSVALTDGAGYTAPNGIIGEFMPMNLALRPRGEFRPIHVTPKLLLELNEKLQDEDSGVRMVSSWTVDRAFVYIDVSDFSTLAPGRQMLVIKSLIRLAGNQTFPWRLAESPKASLCIGDGYIYVFKSANTASYFAAWLAHEIETAVATKALPVEFHFRIGVHIGPVFRFWDPGRTDWNYVGDGINGGNRVLNAMGKDTDDVVFVSSAVRERLIAEHGMEPTENLLRMAMRNRGRHTDKQGKHWRIYELHVGTVFPN